MVLHMIDGLPATTVDAANHLAGATREHDNAKSPPSLSEVENVLRILDEGAFGSWEWYAAGVVRRLSASACRPGFVAVPIDEPTLAMQAAWTNAAPPSKPSLLLRYRAMVAASPTLATRAGIKCTCGLLMYTPTEYAAHCRESPDHFVTVDAAKEPTP